MILAKKQDDLLAGSFSADRIQKHKKNTTPGIRRKNSGCLACIFGRKRQTVLFRKKDCLPIISIFAYFSDFVKA